MNRNLYPWCADSIGIGMVYSMIGFGIFLAFCIVIGTLVTLAFGDLPVPLDRWDVERPMFSWVVSVAATLFMAALLIGSVSNAPTASFAAVPAYIIAIYLVAAARAALLNHNRPAAIL